MADRPIIFSAPMVKALLEGRKTMTRRLVKKPAALDALAVFGADFLLKPGNVDLVSYQVGDRLWVREEYSGDHVYAGQPPRDWGCHPVWYWADGNPEDGDWTKPKPGMHMPRWASRLTLTVTGVKVERLQEISEDDARAEGVLYVPGHGDITLEELRADPGYSNFIDSRMGFELLWNSLHGPDAWAANPWVVAVSFDVAKRNIDAETAAAA